MVMEQDQLPAAPSPSTPHCWLLVAVVPIPTPPDPGHCHLGGQKCPSSHATTFLPLLQGGAGLHLRSQLLTEFPAG